MYGDPRGVIGVVYIGLGKCMVTLGGRLFEIWYVFGDTWGHMGS